MFKKLILIVGSAIGGIYLTSEEGEKARKSLLKKKSTFEPIIKDLLKQANNVLDESSEIQSDDLRANIDKIIKEVKKNLSKIDLEKATEIIQEAIRVSSKKIREVINNTEKELVIKSTKKISKTNNKKVVKEKATLEK